MKDLRAIFDLLPGCYLILSPERPQFKILDVNQAYLKATQKTKAIIGQPMFAVFPDNPDDATATGVQNLTASLIKAVETKKKHVMPFQRYDTLSADGTHFDMRYWKPVNIPVLDKEGNVKCIIHAVTDVTDIVLLRKNINDKDASSQRQISDAIQTTQEMERMEISQELHDNVNQILNTSRLYLEASIESTSADKKHLLLGHSLVEKAMEEVKKISNALIHSSDEEKDLTTTLEHLLEQVMDVKGINIFKKIQLPDETLIESKVKNTIIRIMQEQLANVVKHSEAKNLYIDLNFADNNLELMIKDDGQGFDTTKQTEGRGLQNIKSRAAMMDGRVLITSFPGDGCVIQVHLPIKV